MKWIKFGESYLNMERIEMIRHCSGNIYEAVLTDGRKVVGTKKDLEEMDVLEMCNSHDIASMLE